MSPRKLGGRSIVVSEAWQNDGPAFLCYTAFDGSDAYVGTLPLPENRKDLPELGAQDDLSNFDELLKVLKSVSKRRMYPKFEKGLTRFAGDVEADGVYLKVPAVSYSSLEGDPEETYTEARLLLEEARIHEKILAEPHPGLGSYLGCVVVDDDEDEHNSDGLIARLAFKKYSRNLSDLVWHEPAAAFLLQRRGECMDRIEEAAAHLHRLGLAHMDISPSNIMFDGCGCGMPVLIDLDSCRPFGEPVHKGGFPMGWRGPLFDRGGHFNEASAECDKLAIQGIRNWLAEDWEKKQAAAGAEADTASAV